MEVGERSTAAATSPQEARIERLVEMSRAVLDRLDQGEKLSAILPQARAAAELYGDGAHVHWLDCEIYGLLDVPFGELPRKTNEEKEGAYLFCELRRAQNVAELTVDKVLSDAPKEMLPDRSVVVQHSVGHLERIVEEYRQPTSGDAWAPPGDQILQLGVLYAERRRILDGIRAYVHRYMNRVWTWAHQERDNVKLLGPDYRLVIGSLDALETGVGQELLAALGRLGSTNPAEWSLSALACRNAVLGLGRRLFPLRTGTYDCTMLGKALELKGERELNWLTAYIDRHWRKAEGKTKEDLKALAELARDIYEMASQGKRGTELRLAQAQKLVVDAFQLVAQLKELTGLQPLDDAATVIGD